MFLIVSSAIATFVATSIDYLFILVVLYSQKQNQHKKKDILIGQYLGTYILVGASLLAAYGLSFIPAPWAIGLLGIVPIFLGLKVAFHPEDEEESEELIESSSKYSSLILSVAAITVASGGDNIGVYIPYFASFDWAEIGIILLIYAALVLLLNWTSHKISRLKYVRETVEKYERVIVPVVLVSLGIFILSENGTFEHILGLF